MNSTLAISMNVSLYVCVAMANFTVCTPPSPSNYLENSTPPGTKDWTISKIHYFDGGSSTASTLWLQLLMNHYMSTASIIIDCNPVWFEVIHMIFLIYCEMTWYVSQHMTLLNCFLLHLIHICPRSVSADHDPCHH